MNTKAHKMVISQFIMLNKYLPYPPFMPWGHFGLETQESILLNTSLRDNIHPKKLALIAQFYYDNLLSIFSYLFLKYRTF